MRRMAAVLGYTGSINITFRSGRRPAIKPVHAFPDVEADAAKQGEPDYDADNNFEHKLFRFSLEDFIEDERLVSAEGTGETAKPLGIRFVLQDLNRKNIPVDPPSRPFYVSATFQGRCS